MQELFPTSHDPGPLDEKCNGTLFSSLFMVSLVPIFEPASESFHSRLVAGMLHGLVGYIVDSACCQWKMGKYSKLKVEDNNLPPQSVPTTLGAGDNFIATPTPGLSLMTQDAPSLLAEPAASATQPPTPITPTVPIQTNVLPR